MINVLHVIESLGLGGAERRLLNDLKYLDRGKFSNVVCSLSGIAQKEPERLGGIPLYGFSVSSLGEISGNILAVNKIIKKHKIDIIHTQLFWADLTGRFLKMLNPGVKLVSTIQSSAHERSNPLYSFKRKVIDGLSANIFNDGHIAVSEYVKAISVRHAGLKENKIRVIYNSVDLDYRVPPEKIKALKDEFKIASGQKVLAIVGRIDPPKGHIYLIRAMAEIVKTTRNARLLVIGDGPSRKGLEEEVKKLSLNDQVVFTGVRNDARDILSIADVFVFPTLSEGFSLAVLEALAAGLPCVATNIGPNAEQIKHSENGLLVDPYSPEGIVKAVTYLFSNPEIADSISRKAILSVKQRFSAQENAAVLGEYYAQLLGVPDACAGGAR